MQPYIFKIIIKQEFKNYYHKSLKKKKKPTEHKELNEHRGRNQEHIFLSQKERNNHQDHLFLILIIGISLKVNHKT